MTTTPNPTPDALEALAGQAQALHAATYNAENPEAGADSIPPAPEPPRLSNEQIIGGAVAMVRDTFCAFTGMHSPMRVVTPEKVAALAGAWAAVCDERGINLQDYMGQYGTLFAAIGVTAMVGMQLNVAVRQEMAAMDAAKKTAPVDATATPVA